MKKKPIFISFSSQKGGVGKSTMTTLVASFMHYARGLNVAVVDCDYPQCSLEKLRERELKLVQEDDNYRIRAIEFSKIVQKQPYPIISSKPQAALASAQNAFFVNGESDYDVIFFDMAGTINNDGMLMTYLGMDYVFAPMNPSRMVMESTLIFIDKITEYLKTHPEIRLKEIYMFWNRIDARVKRTLIDSYEGVIKELELKKLNTIIPQSVKFDKEYMANNNAGVFLSTILLPDNALIKGSNIDVLVDEIIDIIGLKKIV